MDSSRLVLMVFVGFLLIVTALNGLPGSTLGAFLDPGAMQELSS